MAVSRAELESMDRDELVDVIVELSQTVEDLQADVEILDEKRAVAGDVRTDMWDELGELQDRVDGLEDENQRLRERLQSADGKREKVASIVRYADNARTGEAAVKLTAKEVSGAAGISRRYAYDLMDGETGLPAEYDWFLTPEEMTQYGDLEIANSDDRRLGIDFEGVHSTGCPLNKFTTATEGEGDAR